MKLCKGVIPFAAGFLLLACGGVGKENPAVSRIVGEPVRVSAAVDAAEPAIVSDKDGSVYVVFVEHAGKGLTDVFLRKYDKEMNAAGATARVSPDGSAKTWKGDPPSAAVGPDGAVYVAWTRALAAGKGTDLVVSVSRDGGRTFAEPVKVNDDVKPASHGMHSMAVDADGRIYLAWLDERNVETGGHTAGVGDAQAPVHAPAGFEFVPVHHHDKRKATPTPVPKTEAAVAEPNSEVFFAYSTDGGRTFSANKKVASDVCPCCKTSMLAAPDGRLYLSWRQVLPGDLRHIAVASTADKGESFSGRAIVSDDQWRLHACPVSGSALAYGNVGKLTVTWYTAGDAGQAGIYSAESADDGRTFGPRRLVSFEAAAGTPVAFPNLHACVFAAKENAITIAGAGTIENATLPAATAAGGRIVTAFVRDENGKRSVWVASVPAG